MVHISVGVHLANIDPCVHVQNNNKKTHTHKYTRMSPTEVPIPVFTRSEP